MGGGRAIRTHKRRKPLPVFKVVFGRPPLFLAVDFLRRIDVLRPLNSAAVCRI
jgi:hypothetical protein